MRRANDIAIYVNRFPRIYRVPTIVAMARKFRQQGIRLVLAVERGEPTPVVRRLLGTRVDIRQFSSIAIRDVEGYRSAWFNVVFSIPFFLECLRLRPRVIVQEGVGGWGLFSPVLKALFGTTIIVSYERTETSEVAASPIKAAYQGMYFRLFTSKVVANGTRTVRLLRTKFRYGGPIAIGNVLPFVPRPSRTTPAATPPPIPPGNGSRESVRVLVIMQLIPRKGVERLACVLDSLGKDPRIQWTIIGSGDGEAAIVERARAYSLTHIPRVDQDRVYDFYRRSDFLLLPTHEDNWSLVAHEAMVCGVVPITTVDNGLVPDVVDSLAGHVLDFDSPGIADDLRLIFSRGRPSASERTRVSCRARRVGHHLGVGSSMASLRS